MYFIGRCVFGRFDCRRSWKLVGTINGQCLQTNPNKYEKYDPENKLEIAFSVNNSDMTGGWNGDDTGATTYYTHHANADD